MSVWLMTRSFSPCIFSFRYCKWSNLIACLTASFYMITSSFEASGRPILWQISLTSLPSPGQSILTCSCSRQLSSCPQMASMRRILASHNLHLIPRSPRAARVARRGEDWKRSETLVHVLKLLLANLVIYCLKGDIA